MEKTKVLCSLIVFGLFFWILPSTGEAATVNCPTDSLQAAIDAAAPWATITVTGTCSEGVDIGPEKTCNNVGRWWDGNNQLPLG